jgi:K(+)-stimulated pyrophosphate-energized sodium pump
MDPFLIPIISGIIALLFTGYLIFRIRNQSSGSEKLREISKFISDGARSYLRKQYRIISIFVIIVAVVLAFA